VCTSPALRGDWEEDEAGGEGEVDDSPGSEDAGDEAMDAMGTGADGY
jgi:hypothetical protein